VLNKLDGEMHCSMEEILEWLFHAINDGASLEDKNLTFCIAGMLQSCDLRKY